MNNNTGSTNAATESVCESIHEAVKCLSIQDRADVYAYVMAYCGGALRTIGEIQAEEKARSK